MDKLSQDKRQFASRTEKNDLLGFILNNINDCNLLFNIYSYSCIIL